MKDTILYKIMIEKNLSLIDSLTENGKYHVLEDSIEKNLYDHVKYCLSLGLDPNRFFKLALRKNNLKIVELLYKYGAIIKQEHCNFFRSFDLIKFLLGKEKSIDRENIFIDFCSKYTQQHISAKEEIEKIIEYLIHTEKFNSQKCLLASVRYGNLKFIKAIISNGANIFENSKQLLIEAIFIQDKIKRFNIINYLILQGVPVFDEDIFDLAYFESDQEIVNLLVENGARVTHRVNLPVNLQEIAIKNYPPAFKNIKNLDPNIEKKYSNFNFFGKFL